VVVACCAAADEAPATPAPPAAFVALTVDSGVLPDPDLAGPDLTPADPGAVTRGATTPGPALAVATAAASVADANCTMALALDPGACAGSSAPIEPAGTTVG
jgi:hypothetical protein